jgi:hypothetical protein
MARKIKRLLFPVRRIRACSFQEWRRIRQVYQARKVSASA